jgi:hypothetical protein
VRVEGWGGIFVRFVGKGVELQFVLVGGWGQNAE